MDQKSLIWIGLLAGSTLGSFIPALWGGGILSMSSIVFSGAGAIAGIWLAFKLSNY